jgi:hypothetical protein
MIFGFCATIAEPDVTILTEQVIEANIGVSKNLFVFFIGAGVGIFVALGIIKIIKNIELKYIYIILFAIIFLLATQVKSEYIAIAFDAGGATTGIVTAPFLLSIAAGVSSKFTPNKDSKEVFGMVGMASLGPILFVLLFFVCFGSKIDSGAISISDVNIFVSVLLNSALAILPLALVFIVYDLLLIKLPLKSKVRFVVGMAITFVGLYLFLLGIEMGISDMGTELGKFLSTLSPYIVVIASVILGFVITFSEPSVNVLAKQVQKATNGNISSTVVIISIAISMAIAITLSALKIIFNINFFYIILIGYVIALALMFVVPEMFTGLAFDSGGVASGPMTSAFILPIMLEFAAQTSNSVNGFGLIGIVGMCPIIVLQILGLIYRFEILGKTKKQEKNALRISYSIDMYSNIEKLEAEYQKMKGEDVNEKQ